MFKTLTVNFSRELSKKSPFFVYNIRSCYLQSNSVKDSLLKGFFETNFIRVQGNALMGVLNTRLREAVD